MDSIESTFLVGATVAWVIFIFSATVFTGVESLSPLTDLIQQSLVDGPRQQDPDDRGEALFLTGVIPGLLAIVTVGIELSKLEESGLDATLWIINSLVFKGCAEAVVALGLLRWVLDVLLWFNNRPRVAHSSLKTSQPEFPV